MLIPFFVVGTDSIDITDTFLSRKKFTVLLNEAIPRLVNVEKRKKKNKTSERHNEQKDKTMQVMRNG